MDIERLTAPILEFLPKEEELPVIDDVNTNKTQSIDEKKEEVNEDTSVNSSKVEITSDSNLQDQNIVEPLKNEAILDSCENENDIPVPDKIEDALLSSQSTDDSSPLKEVDLTETNLTDVSLMPTKLVDENSTENEENCLDKSVISGNLEEMHFGADKKSEDLIQTECTENNDKSSTVGIVDDSVSSNQVNVNDDKEDIAKTNTD